MAQPPLLTGHKYNLHVYPYKLRKTVLKIMTGLGNPNDFTNISLPSLTHFAFCYPKSYSLATSI